MRRAPASRMFALLVTSVVTACAVTSGESLQPDPALATVEVAALGVDPRTQSPVVLLRDPESERVMPIWIGTAEAEAIARSLHGVEMPRPMTHDLLANMVQSLGATVEEVIIREQRQGTYYGVIRLRNGARRDAIEIDSRPSDGLALALRTGATIRVARALLVESLEDAAPPRLTSST